MLSQTLSTYRGTFGHSCEEPLDLKVENNLNPVHSQFHTNCICCQGRQQLFSQNPDLFRLSRLPGRYRYETWEMDSLDAMDLSRCLGARSYIACRCSRLLLHVYRVHSHMVHVG